MKELYNYDSIVWTCQLPDLVKRSILNTAQVRKGVKSLDVCQEPSEMPGVFYVLSGSSGLCITTPDMNSSIGGVIGKGDWIGAHAIGSTEEIFFTTEEIDPLTMLFFSKSSILNLAEQEPIIYKWLYSCAQLEQKLWLQILLSSIHDKTFRVAYLLIEFARRSDVVQGALICINISQYQLSLLSRISRARLNEVLKKFEYDGYILLQRGKVYIKDLRGLEDFLDGMNLMFRDPRCLGDH